MTPLVAVVVALGERCDDGELAACEELWRWHVERAVARGVATDPLHVASLRGLSTRIAALRGWGEVGPPWLVPQGPPAAPSRSPPLVHPTGLRTLEVHAVGAETAFATVDGLNVSPRRPELRARQWTVRAPFHDGVARLEVPAADEVVVVVTGPNGVAVLDPVGVGSTERQLDVREARPAVRVRVVRDGVPVSSARVLATTDDTAAWLEADGDGTLWVEAGTPVRAVSGDGASEVVRAGDGAELALTLPRPRCRLRSTGTPSRLGYPLDEGSEEPTTGEVLDVLPCDEAPVALTRDERVMVHPADAGDGWVRVPNVLVLPADTDPTPYWLFSPVPARSGPVAVPLQLGRVEGGRWFFVQSEVDPASLPRDTVFRGGWFDVQGRTTSVVVHRTEGPRPWLDVVLREPDGTPLPYAELQVVDPSLAGLAVTTDGLGRFSAPAHPDGQARIRTPSGLVEVPPDGLVAIVVSGERPSGSPSELVGEWRDGCTPADPVVVAADDVWASAGPCALVRRIWGHGLDPAVTMCVLPDGSAWTPTLEITRAP
ncbi:MAG: hypothetical protein H6738_12905 [Alphaproteobacteria bacterium]|nr:hypothetical protein [Alphaproteobacteria bacterium]MCB9697674.1 hypothetical protein [Alphaproteobacteria bacterium]